MKSAPSGFCQIALCSSKTVYYNAQITVSNSIPILADIQEAGKQKTVWANSKLYVIIGQ